jgi:hypothetical protein
MRFRLLTPHVIRDVLCPTGTEVEDPPSGPSPLMEGLDPEAVEAVRRQLIAVFGRYDGIPHGLPPGGRPLVDDPPIPRPLDDNQPVFHYSGNKEYLS